MCDPRGGLEAHTHGDDAPTHGMTHPWHLVCPLVQGANLPWRQAHLCPRPYSILGGLCLRAAASGSEATSAPKPKGGACRTLHRPAHRRVHSGPRDQPLQASGEL